MEPSLVLGSYRPVLLGFDHAIESVWCLDSETTGIDVKLGHRIITLGLVELFLKKPISEMIGQKIEWKCNPQRPSDRDAIAVHGITDEEAATYPLFSDQAGDIIETIGSRPIVIYNAAFDKSFLDMELQHCGRPPIGNLILDALQFARSGMPHKQVARLDDMMRHFAIKIERDYHGALKDAIILAHVFRRMFDASLSVSKGYDNQMHFLNPQLAAGGHIRADRCLKQPNAAELAAHEAFMSKYIVKPV